MIRKLYILNLPIYTFMFVWMITILLYFINPFQLKSIRNDTWIIILLGISNVLLGFFIAKLLSSYGKVNFYEYYSKREDYPLNISVIKKLVFILTTVSLVGIIGKNILIISQFGGIERFILNPQEARQFVIDTESGLTYVDPYLFKIFSYFGSLIFVATLLGGLIYTVPKSKLLSLYPLVVSFIAALFTLQRAAFIQNYIFWLISAFLFIYYQPTKFQKHSLKLILKQILYFSIIFVLFSILILLIRFFFTDPENILLIFNSFYFYIAGNIFALDKYLLTDPIPLFGASLFRSINSWLSRFGLLEKSILMPPHYEFYPVYDTEINTFSYIRMVYEDFKIYGVVFISFIWGFISYLMMRAYISKFTLVRFCLSTMIVFSMFWSFYGFFWIHITNVIWRALLFYLIDFYLKTSSKNKIKFSSVY